MPQQADLRASRDTLTPQFVRRNHESQNRSHGRSRSPSGTTPSRTGQDAIACGPEIYVKPDENSPAEQHRIEDVDEHSDEKLASVASWRRSTTKHELATHKLNDLQQNKGDSVYRYPVRRQDWSAGSQPRIETFDSDDRADSESVWSESNTNVHVAALIFNKMACVGTGIFTTPGAVLALTGSKQLSIGLWALGGVYATICVFIYLEYGAALHFTGGELIYLDEVFPFPHLLSTILFSGFILANSTGNALAFAKHTLMIAIPSTTKSTDLDARLVRFVAITILTIICLLHYFSGKLGLFLNKVLALFKGLLLFSVFVAGAVAAHKSGSGVSDFKQNHGLNGHTIRASSLSAMVLILYSYQGWENANYVAGEIKASGRMLRRRAFMAVGSVTILYILVASAFYMACDYTTITKTDTDLGMATIFAPVAFGQTVGLKVSIALSAVGYLVAVIYTSAKMKQAIARQGIIPFSNFFAKDMNIAKGGLLFQRFTTTMFIAFTPNTADGYSFIVGLFTYGHTIISLFVALGIWRPAKRMRLPIPGWTMQYLTRNIIYFGVPIVFITLNALALGFSAIPNKPHTIPRYWWPVISFTVFGGSFIYWLCFYGLQKSFLSRKGQTKTTIGRLIGFEVIVHNETDENPPDEMKAALAQSRLEGTRRRTQYKFGGVFGFIGRAYRAVRNTLGEWFF